MAVSRLMLDNFDHVKAYWISLGVGTAQTALAYGADDLDGTVRHERIHHDAGATSPERFSVEELRSPHRRGRPRAGRTRFALSAGAEGRKRAVGSRQRLVVQPRRPRRDISEHLSCDMPSSSPAGRARGSGP